MSSVQVKNLAAMAAMTVGLEYRILTTEIASAAWTLDWASFLLPASI